jgi:hypothetical protein
VNDDANAEDMALAEAAAVAQVKMLMASSRVIHRLCAARNWLDSGGEEWKGERPKSSTLLAVERSIRDACHVFRTLAMRAED